MGVVAAEMPASWPPEALACQAVAARTRAVGSSAVYGGNGCALHPEADICTDSTCCQGWLSPEARKASWGDGALPCEKRVRQAVSATAGQVLTYDGAPSEVLYHASSGGQTEDAAEVFAMRVPYLHKASPAPGRKVTMAMPGSSVSPRPMLPQSCRRLFRTAAWRRTPCLPN